MSETLGGDFIFTVLSTDFGVGELTTAIYNARMIPEQEFSRVTLNFYPIGTYDARREYFSVDWSIDCRAPSQAQSLSLAVAVRDAINRVTSAVGGYVYHGVVQIGGVIPPANETDVYNTPVTTTVRRR